MKNSVQIFIVLISLLIVSCQSIKEEKPLSSEVVETTEIEEINDDMSYDELMNLYEKKFED